MGDKNKCIKSEKHFNLTLLLLVIILTGIIINSYYKVNLSRRFLGILNLIVFVPSMLLNFINTYLLFRYNCNKFSVNKYCILLIISIVIALYDIWLILQAFYISFSV